MADENETRVQFLLAKVEELSSIVRRLQYGMENATVELTCDEEGEGGTITITFPEPPS